MIQPGDKVCVKDFPEIVGIVISVQTFVSAVCSTIDCNVQLDNGLFIEANKLKLISSPWWNDTVQLPIPMSLPKIEKVILKRIPIKEFRQILCSK